MRVRGVEPRTMGGKPVQIGRRRTAIRPERVGALSVVTASADEAKRVLSNLKRVVRTNYSNPPTHGCQVVATILGTPELRALWEREVGEMRDRETASIAVQAGKGAFTWRCLTSVIAGICDVTSVW